MHDSFNLAWKLNLVVRGLAQPSLLATYEDERRKIANDLINFDAKHCKAFSQGEVALAKNFDENIRFIAGVGAEYAAGALTRIVPGNKYPLPARPGALMIPSKVTRYIDANPVDIQLDIPMLGQFRIYLFVPDVVTALPFLTKVCEQLGKESLGQTSSKALQSYQEKQRKWAEADAYITPERYTAVSDLFTYAVVTQSPKSSFEIADLPSDLQKSRWTLYLDDVDAPSCTSKWNGVLEKTQAGIVIVRPDGYIGAMDTWGLEQGEKAARWVEEYFRGFL